MSESTVSLNVVLSETEAEAFAQFLKRADPEDFRRRAGDHAEAVAMEDAAYKLRAALRAAGFAPR